MMRLAAKLSRDLKNTIGPTFSLVKPPLWPPPEAVAPPPIRQFSADSSTFTPNPVALEMIKRHLACPWPKNRGSHEAAVERLGKIQDLSLSSIAIKVAASEALVGIYLEHYQEDAASAVADLAIQLLGTIRMELGNGGGFEVLEARIKAVKGLIELICGNLDTAQSIFEGVQGERFFIGNATLSYAEFLHGTRKFSTAKELYQKTIQAVSEIKDLGDSNNLGACNMTSEEVAIAAACALGQLEAHMGGKFKMGIEENGRGGRSSIVGEDGRMSMNVGILYCFGDGVLFEWLNKREFFVSFVVSNVLLKSSCIYRHLTVICFDSIGMLSFGIWVEILCMKSSCMWLSEYPRLRNNLDDIAVPGVIKRCTLLKVSDGVIASVEWTEQPKCDTGNLCGFDAGTIVGHIIQRI
ncbi:hypothetical protein Sango_1458000 [Sesamum angolense]|uniref:Uncharacterized protein n=1 Tax=Sesamum angolense TaxID=2727404 RepID=A0AAE2BSK4_9LAMI|nr:hypothetical protein Sango_1458000 [Sesamum angolense]